MPPAEVCHLPLAWLSSANVVSNTARYSALLIVFLTARPKSDARPSVAETDRNCLCGCLPKNQAGNLIEASSDLPCLGGTSNINRSISPRSTRSSCSAIILWCAAVRYRGNVYSVNAIRFSAASFHLRSSRAIWCGVTEESDQLASGPVCCIALVVNGHRRFLRRLAV